MTLYSNESVWRRASIKGHILRAQQIDIISALERTREFQMMDFVGILWAVILFYGVEALRENRRFCDNLTEIMCALF